MPETETAKTAKTVEVPASQITRLRALLGGIPGGMAGLKTDPTFGDIIDCLDRRLAQTREVSANYHRDRERLYRVEADLAAFRRVVLGSVGAALLEELGKGASE